MSRAPWLLACAAFALLSAAPLAAHGATDDGDPAGITPVAATTEAVLERTIAATGERPTREAATWTIAGNDLSGSERDVRLGDDERSTVAMGPLLRTSGVFHGQRWRQTFNGRTVLESGHDPRNDQSAFALVEGAAPDALPAAQIHLLGEIHNPKRYVLRVDFTSSVAEWIFVDEHSNLVARREFVTEGRRETIEYDDYRPLGTYQTPWRIVAHDERPYDTMTYRKLVDRSDMPVAVRDVAVPDNVRRLIEFPSARLSVDLPARFIDGKIVVRATVGDGRGFDAALDTGSSAIVVDRQTIDDLGIPTYGRRSGFSMGPYVKSWAILPKLEIGPVVMHDVVVTVLPLSLIVDERTRVVALLGFDFLADAVFHIDYSHRRVTAIEPSAFHPAGTATRALAVNLTDGVPRTSVAFGGASGDRFILDTGGNRTVVFSHFASQHPMAVHDLELTGDEMQDPRHTRGYGIGGSLNFASVVIPALSIGDRTFSRMSAYRTVDGDFNDEAGDGLIGSDILSAFDLWLDYAESRVLLAT